MLYIIKWSNGLYFHNKGRIILFESINQAKEFINLFIQYSMNELKRQNRMQEAVSMPFTISSNSTIMDIDFDIDKVECGTVFASELFENRGR